MTLLPTALTSPLVRTGTDVVRVASRLRGERAVHARGRAFRASLVVPGGAGTGLPLLDEPGGRDAVVRLSRSAGLPEPLPDVLGLAVRVLDAGAPGEHQDLLLDSALPAPVLRRLPFPGRELGRARWSSLVSYDVAGTSLLLGARLLPGSEGGTRLEAVPADLRFALLVAAPHGPWREVAQVHCAGELPAPHGRRLRFSPVNTGGGLRPAGPFTAWRAASYPASHVAADER